MRLLQLAQHLHRGQTRVGRQQVDEVAPVSVQALGALALPLVAAIPNLPLRLASAATWWWLCELQGLDHGVEQVLPGIKGEVACQRPQVFEEGAPG